jgi:hypothetical protein
MLRTEGVFDFIKKHPGTTLHDMFMEFGQSVSYQIWKLTEKGKIRFIKDKGIRHYFVKRKR